MIVVAPAADRIPIQFLVVVQNKQAVGLEGAAADRACRLFGRPAASRGRPDGYDVCPVAVPRLCSSRIGWVGEEKREIKREFHVISIVLESK